MIRRPAVTRSAQDGAAAVELAVMLPLLLLLLFALFPLVNDIQNYNTLDRALGAGERYATKALRNAEPTPADAAACSSAMRRRRSAEEVRQYVYDAAGGPGGLLADASSVTVQVLQQPPSPEVPDPCNALAGSLVRLSVTYTQNSNPFHAIPNGVVQLFGGDPPFQPATRTLTAEGVLE